MTTETKNKTTMPVWKQDVELGLSQPLGTTLTFQVCAVKNAELLGQAIVDISSLAPDQTVTQTLVLKKDPASAEVRWCCLRFGADDGGADAVIYRTGLR